MQKRGLKLSNNTIASKIVEGIPAQCRIESSSEYTVSLPEGVCMRHSRLYANCAELSHHKEIESVNVACYKHSGNYIYTIEVSRNYGDEEDDTWEL